MASAFSGLFSEYDLTFQVPGSFVTDPATGNVVAGAGSAVAVRCWLKVTRNPATLTAVRSSLTNLGANQTTLVVRGRLIDPVTMPATLKGGMTAPLTLGGTPGTFHLAAPMPGVLPDLDQELGQEILGIWEQH